MGPFEMVVIRLLTVCLIPELKMVMFCVFTGDPETDWSKKPFLARYKVWDGGKLFNGNCSGKFVRGICVFGVGDLMKFPGRKQLFANKFHQDFQPAALECMAERYSGQVATERQGKSHLDVEYYRTLGFVKNQVV